MTVHSGSLLLTPGLSPGNEEVFTSPPCGFLIEIYIFYENWSTETFRNKALRKWAVCSTCKSPLNNNIFG
jgi:hypothetical protein